MLSICITVKNRSLVQTDGHELRLFPNCVESIARAAHAGAALEVVVTDWCSNDWPLNEWFEDTIGPIRHRIVSLQGSFNRGRGRNQAAEAARGDQLFFLDADCTIDASVLAAATRCVEREVAYFPIVYSYHGAAHTTGWWRDEGYGNCAMSRDVFQRVGGWPEYAGWGKEDDDLFKEVGLLVPVLREETPGFFHQWHPENVLWKDRFTERYPWLLKEEKRRDAALSELQQAINGTATLILVDETRFGDNVLPGHTVWPFTEDHGEFGGPPPDDATAIRELERMRTNGAQFIAFAWMSFWWLEFYTEFARHLEAHYHRKLMTPEVIAFDLRERVASFQ